MEMLRLRIMEVENGYIVGDGDPYNGRIGREWVAEDIPTLTKLIEKLALDAHEGKKKPEAL